MRVTLESVLDPDRTKHVIERQRCLIGRADDCDIKELHAFISQYHCELLIDDDVVIVQELGSRNGTFVNGRRIDSERELHDGDQLVVAFIPYLVRIDIVQRVKPDGLWSRWYDRLGSLCTTIV